MTLKTRIQQIMEMFNITVENKKIENKITGSI